MDLKIVRWRWRSSPCAVCRCWLSAYWGSARTCSWQCERIYAEQQGWISRGEAVSSSASDEERVVLNVTLNGTSENRWHRYGLRYNPFPQTGISEFARAELALARLDGDPLTGAADIRARLRGFADDFVDGVVDRFRPGERVSFRINFPRARRG